MVLRQDQERIRTLLKDTITLLCRNGLTFSSEFSIEALIGITLDKDDIFLVNINEIVRNEASKVADDKVPGDGNAASSDNESVTSNTSTPRRRRRKRRMRDIKDEPAVSEEESNPAFETQPDLDNSNSQSITPTTPQHKKSRLNDNSATQLQLKAEPTEDEEDDIVYIKQEMGDSWSEQYQGDEQSHTFTGFSHGADLSGMSQDPGSSNMSGVNMWSPGGQGQGYQPRQGNATVTGSFTDPGGQATSPGGANNQVKKSRPAQPDTKEPIFDHDGYCSKSDCLPGCICKDCSQKKSQISRPQHNTCLQINDQATFRCSTCGKSFPTKKAWEMDQAKHHRKHYYHCELCDKGFSNRENLRGHMSWHTGKKEFRCNICNKEYRYKKHLKDHQVKCHS